MNAFNPWESYKKLFYTWESATATYLEQLLRNPLVLQPAGGMLTAVMKAKAATDKARTSWWGNMGLPTKHDQERTLHKLNQLESRLMDLEERLAERS